MAHTMVPMNIVSAILKSEDILGKNRNWLACNESQHIIKELLARRAELTRFSDKELRSWVDRSAAALNKILKDEGFDITLEEFGPGGFGVVSILDVLVEWLEEGKFSQVAPGDGRRYYPAVKLVNDATELFSGASVMGYRHPIARVLTKSGDVVGMTIADRPREGFDLVKRIDDLRKHAMPSKTYYEDCIFPMVDLNEQKKLDWLIGMKTLSEAGREYYVAEAKQQTKFKMNQFGARVKDAVAVGIRTTSVRVTPKIIIDQPFFLWIEREGVTSAILYAYLDQSVWKNPGDLGNM